MESITEIEGAWDVVLPYSDGQIRLRFNAPEQPDRRTLECELWAWVEGPGVKVDVLSDRVNVLSASGKDTYRRRCEKMHPSVTGEAWVSAMNKAVQMFLAAWRAKDWSVPLEGITYDEYARYLVHPFVLEGLPSILYGAGGTGKTYLALALAKAVAEDGVFFGTQVKMGRVLYMDYEATARDVKRRLRALGMERLDGVIYWPGRGQPVTESLPALARTVAERDVALVVVDSAALAAGGDPKDEQTATGYFRALASLNVATLTVAHLTKDQRNEDAPFGSIFWSNCARLTWLVKAPEEEENPKHLGLFCKKSNEDRRHKPIGVSLDFDGKAVTVKREDVARSLDMALPVSFRLRRELGRGERSVRWLAEEIGVSEDTVSRTLRRAGWAVQLSRADDGTRHWGLLAD